MINITENNFDLCRRWMLLAIYALAISGILSISVILLRFPIVNKIFPEVYKFFDTSLVIHVNLSVLVWMCSITAIVLSFLISSSKYLKYFRLLYYLAFLGTTLMVCSMFIANTTVLKNNYIPVLNNKLFLLGLWLFLGSIFSYSFLVFRSTDFKSTNFFSSSFVFLGACGSSVMITSVFICFFIAYRNITIDDPLMFYEQLFWGGGHLLQFVFTQVLLVIYLILLEFDGKTLSSLRCINIVFVINTFLVICAPVMYLLYDVDSPILINFFTWHMRIAGALIPIVLLIITTFNIRDLFIRRKHPLLCATLIFFYGGVLGLLVVEGNVTVPAHYHGSIVGMTILFMGFIYWILPKLKINPVNYKVINFQVYLYTFGQFLHITGLEFLGGYGALRKVAYLPTISSMFAKFFFFIGGIMAVIGGSLFVVLVMSTITKSWVANILLKK